MGRLPTVPTDLSSAKTRFSSTPRPQVIHKNSTPLSTLIPQVAHTQCTARPSHSSGRFRPRRTPTEPGYKSAHTWGQPWGQLGLAVDESEAVRIYPPTARTIHRSATRATHTPATAVTCANELNPHNPQHLLLLLSLRSSKKENKTKTSGGRSWGQLLRRVAMSTKPGGGRGDAGRRDGLTWTPALFCTPAARRRCRLGPSRSPATTHLTVRLRPSGPRRPARAAGARSSKGCAHEDPRRA